MKINNIHTKIEVSLQTANSPKKYRHAGTQSHRRFTNTSPILPLILHDTASFPPSLHPPALHRPTRFMQWWKVLTHFHLNQSQFSARCLPPPLFPTLTHPPPHLSPTISHSIYRGVSRSGLSSFTPSSLTYTHHSKPGNGIMNSGIISNYSRSNSTR